MIEKQMQEAIDAVQEDPVESPSRPALTEETFGDSELYKEVRDLILDSFAEFSPVIDYDSENSLLNIVLVAGAGTDLALRITPDTVKDSWKTMTSSLDQLTVLVSQMLTEKELNIGCSVLLVSDEDPDDALYGVLNGIEVYNALSE